MAPAIPITTPQNFDVQARRAAAWLSRPVKLKEIVLPAGDVQGFSVDYVGSTGLTALKSSDWAGYDGVRIVGQGIDRTHIRQNWYGWTLFVEQFAGVLQLEELTIHTSSTWGAATCFGLQNSAKKITPGFQFRAVNVKAIVDEPLPGAGRGKWLFFGYQYDEYLKNTILDGTQAREHDRYGHGNAGRGSLWEGVEIVGAGAQPDKTRPDFTETAYTGRNGWIIRKDITYQNWYQPWSDRGGAAFVLESGCSNVLLERCKFYGGGTNGPIQANARSHAIMISAEANGYDILTGRVGVGFGNGLVKIKDCAAVGFSANEWSNELISVYSNAPGMQAARGVLIENCGLFGAGMQIKLDKIPTGQVLVTDCNTDAIREACARIGMAVGVEAHINDRNRQIPVSEGYRA